MNYLGALTAGFTVEQVLNYLSKNFPDLGPRIKQAVNAGKSPEDILKYLSKFDKNQLSNLKSNRKPFEPFPESGTSNRYIQGQNAQKELNPIPQSVKTGMLGAAGLMVAPMAASALSSALPAARTALSRAAPQLLGQGAIPGSTPPNIPSLPIPNAPNSVNQQPTSQITPVNQTKAINVIDLLNKHKFSEKIESILKSGNDPEQAAAFYRELNPTTVTQIEKEAGKPFEEVVREYAQLKTPKEETQPETPLENPLEEPPEELPEEPRGPKKPPPSPNRPSGTSNLSRQAIEESFKQAPVPTKPVDIGSKSVEKTSKADKELELYKPTGKDYTLSKEYIGKWYSSKPGEFVGTLKDFFTGEKLREKFRDVLSTRVYKGSPQYRTKEGQEAYAGYGEGNILLNSFDENSIFPLLVEEASHALQDVKNRLTGESESDYEENINEKSAKKHVDYLNKFYKKENEITKQKEKEEIQKRIEKALKGHIVETPEGVGEVREIRNGKALVEVDGKMRQMLEDELMSPGLPQKDLADLHEELIEGIKTHTGKEVSRHVEWAGYDPEHKELIYKPWSGEQYTYGDIDQEDADMLTSLLTQRKTSGENYIGAWEEGTESPIGAAMHKLLTKLRDKAKESGKEKAHIRKYETIYSAYEPAQKASKKKKDEERKRIRAEEKRRKEAEKQDRKHSRSFSRVS